MDIFTYYFRKADQLVELLWIRIRILFLWVMVFVKKPRTVTVLAWLNIQSYLANLKIYLYMKRTRYWDQHIMLLPPEFFKRLFVEGKFSHRWATFKVLSETDEYLYCKSDMNFYMYLTLKNGMIYKINTYWFKPSF